MPTKTARAATTVLKTGATGLAAAVVVVGVVGLGPSVLPLQGAGMSMPQRVCKWSAAGTMPPKSRRFKQQPAVTTVACSVV